jgi:hypothetical protein
MEATIRYYPYEGTMRRILHRASACCHAAVYHPKAWTACRLPDVLRIACGACKRTTHLVLMEGRRVVWETPVEER